MGCYEMGIPNPTRTPPQDITTAPELAHRCTTRDTAQTGGKTLRLRRGRHAPHWPQLLAPPTRRETRDTGAVAGPTPDARPATATTTAAGQDHDRPAGRGEAHAISALLLESAAARGEVEAVTDSAVAEVGVHDRLTPPEHELTFEPSNECSFSRDGVKGRYL